MLFRYWGLFRTLSNISDVNSFFCEEKSAIIDVISVSPHKKSFLYGQIRRAEKVNTEYVTMQDCKDI